MKATGCLPSPPDPRDYDADRLLGSLRVPRAASVEHLSPGIRDQGIEDSCVGFAVAAAAEIAAAAEGRGWPRLSPMFVWAQSRHQHSPRDQPLTPLGTYLRTAIQAVKSFGFASEDAWPYTPNAAETWNGQRIARREARPPLRVMRAAHDQRGPRQYARCFGVDAIRKAIASDQPVVCGLMVDAAFGNNSGGDHVRAMTGGSGHALCLVGYDGEWFRLHNSWGEQWRDGGRCWLHEDVVRGAFDAWLIDL